MVKVCNIYKLKYSANHNALDSLSISVHLAFRNDELCKNRHVSERRSIEEQQYVQYVENNVFFKLKPHKHILHYTKYPK